MQILRNPITSEAWALHLVTAEDLPELDALAEKDLEPCQMVASYSPGRTEYKLICPTSWFDLWGWADE